jgi:hypothetical protein
LSRSRRPGHGAAGLDRAEFVRIAVSIALTPTSQGL